MTEQLMTDQLSPPSGPGRAWRLCAALTCLTLAACAPVTPRLGSTSAEWVASPNFGPRKANFVILHHTSNDTLEQALKTLTTPARAVSSHYLIGRDGRVLQLVDENARAWHAGLSWWGGQTDMNSASIGIELDNNGFEPFPEVQIQALLTLLQDIQTRHSIPRANFLGHADVAPGRKVDPSTYFPWRRLAAAGFGLWCEPPYNVVPPGFDALLGLAALGYDTSRPEAALAAFRLRYRPADSNSATTDITPEEQALLYCLLSQRGS